VLQCEGWTPAGGFARQAEEPSTWLLGGLPSSGGQGALRKDEGRELVAEPRVWL